MNTSVMPLQQRIVTLLEEQGPIGAKEIRLWLKGVDGIALDTQLEALKRSGQIVLGGSIYSLASEPASDMPAETQTIPTAAEEAAASLQPTRDQVNAVALECAQATRRAARAASPKLPTPAQEKQCTECMHWKPLVEFRLIGGPNGDTRAERCNKCHGKPIRAAKAAKACQSGPEPGGPKIDSCPSCGAIRGGDGVRDHKPGCGFGPAIEAFGSPIEELAAPLGNSAPEKTLTVVIDVASMIRLRRQDIANQIELARVALDNLVNKQLEYDRYLELHERLSKEVAA